MDTRIEPKLSGTAGNQGAPAPDAPHEGWKVERDNTGNVTITPPPFLQGGTDFWADFELAMNQNADGPVDIDAILALVVKMCALRQKNDRETRLSFLVSRLEAMTAAGDEALKAAGKRFISGIVGGSLQAAAGLGNIAGSVSALKGMKNANTVIQQNAKAATDAGQLDAKALCPDHQISNFNRLTSPSQSYMRLTDGLGSVVHGVGQTSGAALEQDAAQVERKKVEMDKLSELADAGRSSAADGLQQAKEDERSYMSIINNLEQNRTDTEKMVIQYI